MLTNVKLFTPSDMGGVVEIGIARLPVITHIGVRRVPSLVYNEYTPGVLKLIQLGGRMFQVSESSRNVHSACVPEELAKSAVNLHPATA